MKMNIVLLAVCSSIFPAVCLKLSSCLELGVAHWEELCVRAKAIKLRLRERAFEGIVHI